MSAATGLFALRVVVATTLLLAVAGKVRDPGAFGQSVAALTGVRAGPARALALAVLVAEGAVAGLLLAWPVGSRVALLVAAALLGGFTAVLVAGLRQPYRPACNCFGVSQRPISAWDVARNLVLAGGCVTGAALAPAGTAAAVAAADRVPLALAAIAVGVAVAHLHDIGTTLTRPLETS